MSESVQQNNQPFEICSYAPRYKQAFYDLNYAWVAKYFVVEPIDELYLSNPEDKILKTGGEIYFAIIDGKAVGAVALKHDGDGVFELTKLGVDPSVQKCGMGRALCVKVIERFQALKGKKLYLDTNSILPDAIRIYERLNFKHMDRPEPALYDRADVYMEWQA